MSRLGLGLFLVLAGTGCQSPTDCGPDNSGLVGSWRYTAVQEIPGQGQVSGTLVVSAVACDLLSGQLDITTTDAQGATRRMAGPVQGSISSSGGLRFEAELADGIRRHLATVTGDSLAGSWVNVGEDGTAAGPFGGKRQ